MPERQVLAKQACYTRSVPSRQGRTFHRKVTKFFCPTFCVLQKVGKEFAARRRRGRGAAKDLIGLVRSCSFGPLIRGLQNLESPFWKGFNFVSGKVLFGCADSRFTEPRCSLQRERIVTFCVVQKVTKKHTGLRPATSIQSSAGEGFSRAFRRHEPKPAFRTKRRRKGFESVRGSGVTA